MAKGEGGKQDKRKQSIRESENGAAEAGQDQNDTPEVFREFKLWRKIAEITEESTKQIADTETNVTKESASGTKPDDDFVQRYQERFVTAFAQELETLRESENLDAEAAERLVDVIHAFAEAVPLIERQLPSPEPSTSQDGGAEGERAEKSSAKKKPKAATEEGTKDRKQRKKSVE